MEKVGVDIVLSTRLLSAGGLAFARGGVVSVSLLEGAKAEAVEVIVQEGAPVIGKRLMDLQPARMPDLRLCPRWKRTFRTASRSSWKATASSSSVRQNIHKGHAVL